MVEIGDIATYTGNSSYIRTVIAQNDLDKDSLVFKVVYERHKNDSWVICKCLNVDFSSPHDSSTSDLQICTQDNHVWIHRDALTKCTTFPVDFEKPSPIIRKIRLMERRHNNYLKEK